jgi:sulfur carrier protein ThiS
MSQIRDSARANARTISVTVAFSADLRRFLARGADGPQGYTMPEGATVADLLAVIGVEADAELIIAVDGELAGRNTPLRDGAEVMLLHPMEGGSRRRGDHSDADLTAGNVGSRKGVLLSHQAVKSPPLRGRRDRRARHEGRNIPIEKPRNPAGEYRSRPPAARGFGWKPLLDRLHGVPKVLTTDR